MLFSSLIFLYVFIPALILMYFLLPQKARNYVLLLFSLVFYAWGEPRYLIFIFVSITIGYLSGLLMEKVQKRGWKKAVMILSVAAILSFLAYFKYADFAISTINGIIGGNTPLLRLALPIGISFYTFQILSYSVDIYLQKAKVQKNPFYFATYVVFFPQLIAGPIVRYRDIAAELEERKCSWDLAYEGAVRFLVGLSKKVLLANQLGALVNAYSTTKETTVLFGWIAALAYMLQIYLDFSGYSDMAIGLGKIFGFHFPENFKYPYLAVSLTDFWRRWHITLGAWFRDYVYIPLGGNRVSKPRWLLNIVIVWCLTGLWHGAGWNFVLWGLFFGVLLIAEKLWYHEFLESHRWLGHIYVLAAVFLSFVLFRFDSLGQAAADFKVLFGFGSLPLAGTHTLYCLRSNLMLLLVSMVACTPLPAFLFRKLEGSRAAFVVSFIKPLGLAALLLLSTAFLVDGSFDPFLYFRF